jgi:hypothetical protein
VDAHEIYKTLQRVNLSKRLAILQTNNTRIEAEITKGCSQGLCSGPGLWNIQYNSLLNVEYNNRTKAIAFADDLILLTRGKTVREPENVTNIEVTKISTWTKTNKIQFNDSKSKAMLLSRQKRKERRELDIFLNKQPITHVHNVKYLGIILNSKLSFKDHLNYMTEKCSKLIFALSKYAKLNWGLSHAALKTIYTGAILPLLQYGAPLWIHAINNANYRSKLIRVQRLINIRIAKAYRTVSNEALCMITGLTPIYIILEETAQYYNLIKAGMMR